MIRKPSLKEEIVLIKKSLPDEWLLITDFDLDKYGHIIAGIVNRHFLVPALRACRCRSSEIRL